MLDVCVSLSVLFCYLSSVVVILMIWDVLSDPSGFDHILTF